MSDLANIPILVHSEKVVHLLQGSPSLGLSVSGPDTEGENAGAGLTVSGKQSHKKGRAASVTDIHTR